MFFIKKSLHYQTGEESAKIISKHQNLFDFNNKNLCKAYDSLVIYSNKYDILATDILYPTKMEDIINELSNDYYPPRLQRFKININNKFAIIQQNNEIFAIPSNDLITEEDTDYLKFQFINNKINNNVDIKNFEWDFYNLFDKTESIRVDSFAKYIFGLYIWDYYKDKNTKAIDDIDSSVFKLYSNYRHRVDKCEKDCNCSYCGKKDSCASALRKARLVTSNSIKECKLLDSTTKGKYITPQNKKLLERKNLNWFFGQEN
ncbi:MAG: hypothetical protein IKO41_21230 [Lachnospiraceae bacterium]|nr:hypothetical protein [Lachnospiraceae bacterium]